MRAPPAASRSAMCACASATNASSKKPAGDAGLVGDDDHREAGAVEQPHRVDAVRETTQPLEPIEIADSSISVPSRSRNTAALHRARLRRPSPDGRSRTRSTASTVDAVSCSGDRSDSRAACRGGRTRGARARRASPGRRGDPLVGRPEDRRRPARRAPRRGASRPNRSTRTRRTAPSRRPAAAGRCGRSDSTTRASGGSDDSIARPASRSPAGADQHAARRRARATARRSTSATRSRRPALGVAVGGARREADERSRRRRRRASPAARPRAPSVAGTGDRSRGRGSPARQIPAPRTRSR